LRKNYPTPQYKGTARKSWVFGLSYYILFFLTRWSVNAVKSISIAQPNMILQTGGLIDVFLPQDLETLLAETSTISASEQGLVNMVVAIGLQCKPSTEPHDHGLTYFRAAQSQAFAGMLEDPDINMVRTFLLMAFYLLGECRRNTAFIYLGIAARTAVALGLHRRETYTNMDDAKHQLR
jgi:hypothetical protein